MMGSLCTRAKMQREAKLERWRLLKVVRTGICACLVKCI